MRIIVTSPICGHRWTVEREKLIEGTWHECPKCKKDKKGGDNP